MRSDCLACWKMLCAMPCMYFRVFIALLVTSCGHGWSCANRRLHFPTELCACCDRRNWLLDILAAPPIGLVVTAARATENASASVTDPGTALRQARSTLQTLLDNWERAVIDCTYADVPRELLETKNKKELLEKASTFALFDKSVSVVSCKTTNRNVRDYLGRTSIGPLVGLDKHLKAALDLVNDNDLDDYVQLSEDLQRSLNKADSLSYAARKDFTAINNFDVADKAKVLNDRTGSLSQAKVAIAEAVDQLDQIFKLLPSA